MGLLGLIKKAISPITSIIDKAVRDKDLAKELNHKIESQLIESFSREFEAQRDVLVAEIGSDSWLAANWRPILMLAFTGIVVNNYILSPYLQAMFGFSVSLEIPPDMWDLLKIGVGGYIVGRSAEKGIAKWKSNTN